jgi:NarL family two-component system response regulator YdfI
VIRVLLADNYPMVRKGLRMRLALEQDIDVVGEASSGPEALCLAQALAPDIVIMGVELPLMDGIEATRQLRIMAPETAVVMLSIHDDAATKARARAAGAAAFVEKHGGVALLLDTIRRIAKRQERAAGI